MCWPNKKFHLNKMGTNDDTSHKSYDHISITPQMLRTAIKRLQLRKAYVALSLISEYFRRSYPVESNIQKFNDELKKKLDCAVYVGLLLKHGESAYYLPTLREEANALKTAFTAFWEVYRNYSKVCVTRSRNQNGNCTISKQKIKDLRSNRRRSK